MEEVFTLRKQSIFDALLVTCKIILHCLVEEVSIPIHGKFLSQIIPSFQTILPKQVMGEVYFQITL